MTDPDVPTRLADVTHEWLLSGLLEPGDTLHDLDRLTAVQRLVLDNPHARTLVADLLEQAAATTGSATALLNVVLDDVQLVVSAHGLDGWLAEAGACPADWSFCARVVRTAGPYVVEDASLVPVQRDSPLVTVDGRPGLPRGAADHAGGIRPRGAVRPRRGAARVLRSRRERPATARRGGRAALRGARRSGGAARGRRLGWWHGRCWGPRMTVRRVVGTETEYGVSVPGQATNAMVASSQVVNGYVSTTPLRDRRTRWDFEEENPLRDARGFDVGAGLSDHYAGEPDDELGLANVILTNGARLYVDHAHPEYSTPECTGPRDVLLWDKAGERVMELAAQRARALPGSSPIQLYKNNTDNKGASYGTHENYLMARQTAFGEIVRHLTPFFVSRQVVTGAGRVGIGQDGRVDGFQISQRADFFEVEVGLETTLKRPIINTRDEPHADPDKYRRLHVIIGDANLSEVSTYLKVGTTALVLAMVEDRWLTDNGVDLGVVDPVASLRAVSHDPSLKHLLTLRDGRTLTAVQLQMDYLEQARKHVDDRLGSDADAQTRDVLARWESVLTRLETDPSSLSRELDWVAKQQLLEGYRDREGLDWSAPKLHLVDLQYSDVRRDKGLYNRLVARGSMELLLTEDEVQAAVLAPPVDTRAYFRGRCLEKYPTEVAAASWDSVIFDVGRESLQRVPTLEPLRGTKAHVGDLLDSCDTALELVETLAGSARASLAASQPVERLPGPLGSLPRAPAPRRPSRRPARPPPRPPAGPEWRCPGPRGPRRSSCSSRATCSAASAARVLGAVLRRLRGPAGVHRVVQGPGGVLGGPLGGGELLTALLGGRLGVVLGRGLGLGLGLGRGRGRGLGGRGGHGVGDRALEVDAAEAGVGQRAHQPARPHRLGRALVGHRRLEGALDLGPYGCGDRPGRRAPPPGS